MRAPVDLNHLTPPAGERPGNQPAPDVLTLGAWRATLAPTPAGARRLWHALLDHHGGDAAAAFGTVLYRLAELELAATRKAPPGEPTGPSHLNEPGATGSTVSILDRADGGGHG